MPSQEARKVLSFKKEPYSKVLCQDKFGMYNSRTASSVNWLAPGPSKASGQVKKPEPNDVLDGKGAPTAVRSTQVMAII